MAFTKQHPYRSRLILPALAATLFAVVSGLALSACGSSSQAEKTGAQKTEEPAEKPAFNESSYTGPNFALMSVDGPVVKFTDLLGKGPVALNFWGTWCGPCRHEMPEFKRIWSEYEPKGVQLVGVALRDTPLRVLNYTTQQEITWLQLMGTPQTANDYGRINGIPTTIFYSSQGVELSRYVGPMPYYLLKQRLDEALDNEANQST